MAASSLTDQSQAESTNVKCLWETRSVSPPSFVRTVCHSVRGDVQEKDGKPAEAPDHWMPGPPSLTKTFQFCIPACNPSLLVKISEGKPQWGGRGG